MAIGRIGKNFRQQVKNKNVLIFGLGVLGRGLKDALYLAKCGANVRVTDMKSESELMTSVNKLKKHKQIKLVLGQHREEDIIWADIIIRNAGVKPDSDWMQMAKKYNKKVVMDESWFSENFPGKLIGITGTKGKSTVTGLLFHILKSYKADTFLGGNVVGVASLPLLDKVNDDSWVVMELSSWQLQGFGDIKKSPNISVFTNVYPDHLNYYDSMTSYIADKKHIYLWQSPDDFLLINDYQKEAKEFKKEAKGKVIVFKKNQAKDYRRKLLGDHNLYNIASVLAVTKLLKVPEKFIKSGIASYVGEPYRLQIVGHDQRKKLVFINDSAATTTVALLSGLATTAEIVKNKVVLIFGGSDKNNSWQEISSALKKHCRALVIIKGTAQEKIIELLTKQKIKLEYVLVDSMDMAVAEAYNLAQKNDAILLSPGCASFGVFKNEFDRGQKFDQAIKKYVKKK